ncbi:DNA-packaging protein [Parasphingorhabdus cellanae]|uniref:DNA-packaging protein n=1 Tax=Parasphingorhabdus cellanae TaxID=2806553 RepID=A0ABX7T8U3_9SPHN|nr:terminase family protein [Parasphingorhabdus cellanae]QTD57566.1 DNA-packaging protein [Parasphingorhabdus cellanae]
MTHDVITARQINQIEDDDDRAFFLGCMDSETRLEYEASWHKWARQEQLAPTGDWTVWMIMAGRGFGKTRAGAEWVREICEADGSARFALVGANFAETRMVMVEGESGLLSIAPDDTRPLWEPSLKRLRWSSGAEAYLYSAAEPEGLRGPQHSHSWCDEIAKWANNSGQALAAWDNLKMGLRLGHAPKIAATTTPRPVALVRNLVKGDYQTRGVVITRGGTTDNVANLPGEFIKVMEADYGGTRLGRQELDGELIEELEGALWSRAMLEACRVAADDAANAVRIVIGVDPPASQTGDACGIIVAGLRTDNKAVILADCSAEKASPETWARAVAKAARNWGADRVIAEANQGGAMVQSVLHATNVSLPVRLVHASRGKVARAEPVAALYEAGRVLHAGAFPRLEDELCGLLIGGGYEGPGRSPDRADALVYALTELMLGKRRKPRVGSLY